MVYFLLKVTLLQRKIPNFDAVLPMFVLVQIQLSIHLIENCRQNVSKK